MKKPTKQSKSGSLDFLKDVRILGSENTLDWVINNAPLVMVVIDKDGIFKMHAGKGIEVDGQKQGMFIGQSIHEIYRDYPDILEHFSQALKGENGTDIMQVDGHTYDVAYVSLLDKKGNVPGVLSVSTDITKWKQAQDALETRNQELEEINKNLVGRESRMIELKEETVKLRQQLANKK